MEGHDPGSMRKCKVTIPEELRDSLREVHEVIRAARHDPDIHLDFDDAIQVERICSGRTPADRKRFVVLIILK